MLTAPHLLDSKGSGRGFKLPLELPLLTVQLVVAPRPSSSCLALLFQGGQPLLGQFSVDLRRIDLLGLTALDQFLGLLQLLSSQRVLGDLLCYLVKFLANLVGVLV